MILLLAALTLMAFAKTLVDYFRSKVERPSVVVGSGHVAYLTFAVIDVPKEQENGNGGHGSKVVVVPFDGRALDRDLARRK